VHLSLDKSGILRASTFERKGARKTFTRDLLSLATSLSGASTSSDLQNLAKELSTAFPRPLNQCWLSWRPKDKDICPSSIAHYMQESLHFRVIEAWPTLDSSPIKITLNDLPLLLDKGKNTLNDALSAEEGAAIEDMVGAALLGLNEEDIAAKTSNIIEIHTFKGLYLSENLTKLVSTLSSTMKQNKWCLMTEGSSWTTTNSGGGGSGGNLIVRSLWGVVPIGEKKFYEWTNSIHGQN